MSIMHSRIPDTMPGEDQSVTTLLKSSGAPNDSRKKMSALRQRVIDTMKMKTGSVVEFYNVEKDGRKQHLRCIYNKIVQNSLFLLGVGKGNCYRYDNVSGLLYRMNSESEEFQLLGNYNMHLPEPKNIISIHEKQLLTFLDPDTKEIHHFRASQICPKVNSSVLNVRISKGSIDSTYWFEFPVEGINTTQKLELRAARKDGLRKSLVFLGTFQ